MQEKNSRRSNRQRSDATRTALLDAARMLFVEKGYAETGTPEIVRAAAVTRGALYHHFADKADLLRGVIVRELAAVTAEINAASADAASTHDALLQGAEAWFDAMADAGRARLLLLDGPAVLGRAEMDEIDRKTSAGTLVEGLEAGQQAGDIADVPVPALASLLSAMFDRAALDIVGGASRDDYLAAIRPLLRGLGR